MDKQQETSTQNRICPNGVINDNENHGLSRNSSLFRAGYH